MPTKSSATERSLVRRYAQLYPHELALFVETLAPDDARDVIAVLSAHDAAPVFRRLGADAATAVLDRMDDRAAGRLLSELDPPLAAAIIARLDPDRRESRLASLEQSERTEITALMTYAPDTAGGMMDARVTTFRPDSTVREVTKRIRSFRTRRISDVFVVDDDGMLIGAVALQDLVQAQPSDTLDGLVRRRGVSVRSTASREEVLEVLNLSKATSLPVTDFEGRVIGVIRHDALIAAAQEEATADVQTMVGASKDERALSKVSFAVRRRLPWLQVNLGTAFLAAAVVGLFEGTIARFTALAVLLPVVAGQSGNTGSQALAVTMRGLALREIRGRHWLRVSIKEVAAGAINGIAVSLVTAIAVYIWSGSMGLTGVIAIAMVVSMAIAGLAGASIPMILVRLGQDPAQASSIILTTVTDVVGFLSFLGLATLAAGLL
ncbi:MAG: magnesium transporter [Gemmatimonadota bacterium]|nr:MAG: magnesium transporter [Gemmatimonadota bacterium]